MSIQIEEGKFYKARDGRKFGPMVRTGVSNWCWTDNSLAAGVPCWTAVGAIGWSDFAPSDLIEEWSEPETTQEAGPVRTVTRREIVPGDYDRVTVANVGYDGPLPSHKAWVHLEFKAEDWNANELRSAAMIFSQLAEALDDQP